MNPEITAILWVGLGDGLGAVARYSVGTAIAHLAGSKILWGTLTVKYPGVLSPRLFRHSGTVGRIHTTRPRYSLPCGAWRLWRLQDLFRLQPGNT